MVDDNAAGYFQMALLGTTGNQFYLDWHAKYKHDLSIYNKAGMDSIIKRLCSTSVGMPMPLSTHLKTKLQLNLELIGSSRQI